MEGVNDPRILIDVLASVSACEFDEFLEGCHCLEECKVPSSLSARCIPHRFNFVIHAHASGVYDLDIELS